MKQNISISLSSEMLKAIDQIKGIATRSAQIEFLLKKSLESKDGRIN